MKLGGSFASGVVVRTYFVRRKVRRGIGLLDVSVVLFVLVCFCAIGFPALTRQRETGGRIYSCRNTMRGLATALFNYQVRTGNYPGYMNALECTDGRPYVDPTTGAATPVSWVVMILPDIDRAPLFDQWKLAPQDAKIADKRLLDPRVYIDQFLCPSDPQASKTGTPISFVVNTGMPDAPAAIINEQEPVRSVPRDWAANGMFFDNYSEHPLVQRDERRRAAMVLMRDEKVQDPKSRTILLTENIDATNYAFDAATQSADGWRSVEMETGCIWRPGTFTTSRGAPVMQPPAASLHPNVGRGPGDGKSFDHTRPSSRHPQSVNVAFVEINVAPLRDSISYFVYAKLMASDDAHMAPAGRRPDPAAVDAIDPHRHLRDYQLKEADMEP